MKTIAIYNIKGGVGKTAAAVNLSYLAAKDGHRTLLCDLDPQGSASFYLRVRSGGGAGAKKLLEGGKKVDKRIRESDYENLHVLPASMAYRNLDIELDAKKRSKKRLRETLDEFKDDYDVVILDAPPNITLLSENIFRAADLILVPVIPTTLSRMTYGQIIDFFNEEGISLKKLRAFFSMVERRKKLHTEQIDELLAEDKHFLDIRVPMASVVEQMGVHREPLPAYAAKSQAAQAYQSLWSEARQLVA